MVGKYRVVRHPGKRKSSLTKDISQHDVEDSYRLTEYDVAQIKKMVRYGEQIADLLMLRNRPFRFIWLNLLSGMAKGFGIALGITVIAFLAFKILVGLQILDLPIIGDFVAELIEYINNVQNIV